VPTVRILLATSRRLSARSHMQHRRGIFYATVSTPASTLSAIVTPCLHCIPCRRVSPMGFFDITPERAGPITRAHILVMVLGFGRNTLE